MTKPTLEQQVQWARDFADDVEKLGSYEKAVAQWQFLDASSRWNSIDAMSDLLFFDGCYYQRKPKVRIINGFEVPAPVPKDCGKVTSDFWGLQPGCVRSIDHITAWNIEGRASLLLDGFVFHSKLDALKNLYALRGDDPVTAPCDD